MPRYATYDTIRTDTEKAREHNSYKPIFKATPKHRYTISQLPIATFAVRFSRGMFILGIFLTD